MGLTAIPSADVLDIMSRDFYDKYEEYMAVVAERKDRTNRQTTYSTAVAVERHQLANFIEIAEITCIKSICMRNLEKVLQSSRKPFFEQI